MKRSFLVLILLLIIILNTPYFISAQSFEPDFHEMFNDHGLNMLLINSKTGEILYANKSSADFYGYAKEELESMKISDINTLSPEETAEEMRSGVNEERNYFVFKHRLANGEIRTVEVYSYPYFFQDTEMLFSIIHDITPEILLKEKNNKITRTIYIGAAAAIIILLVLIFLLLKNLKKIEMKNEELKNFNKLRKTFIDADKRLIYLKDENLKYIFVNKGVEEFYNKDSSEIVGYDDFALTNDEFAEIRRKTDKKVLEKMSHIVDEVKWGDKIYKTNKFPIELLNGYYGVGAYIEDVTEAKRRKQEIQKSLLRNSILVDVFNHDFNSSYEQLDYVLNKALELTESKFGYIYLYDDQKEEFTLNSWSQDVMDECKIVDKQIKYQLKNTGLWGEVVRKKKPLIINDFVKPNKLKKGYPEGHVKLTKFMSVPVIIDNQIVAVIGLANKKDDYNDNDIYQINVLMTGVWNAIERKEREIELEETNTELTESKEKLQLILDSTAEGIYGLNKKGQCTFINAGGLKMLGYSDQKQLLKENMHKQIHHSYRNGSPMPLEECKIYKAFMDGSGTHVDDEVFWRADGTSFEVEYYSYPQYKRGEIVGAVVTFMDNTERKKNEEYIEYLSYHDSLTGLYNRNFFDNELKRIDVEKNYPISVIFADVNGLKLINDVFGHDAGDELLMRVAEIFQRVCRDEDIIARIGGDEFAILLTNTIKSDVEKIVNRIRMEFRNEQISAIKGSVSIGCETKINPEQDIEKILTNAEEKMYKEKTLNREENDSEMINTIIETLHKKSVREKSHSTNVSELCQKIGQALNLPETELWKLKEIGFLHDIGKITLDEALLNKDGALSEKERKEIQQHPVVGYRILNLFAGTMDLAEGVLNHHENWDGSGYPGGKKGEEIPLLSRIIRVAESYDAMLNRVINYSRKKKITKEKALEKIKEQSGVKFSPEIVDAFLKMMKND